MCRQLSTTSQCNITALTRKVLRLEGLWQKIYLALKESMRQMPAALQCRCSCKTHYWLVTLVNFYCVTGWIEIFQLGSSCKTHYWLVTLVNFCCVTGWIEIFQLDSELVLNYQ